MLKIHKIHFPGLGIGPVEIDSVAFSIGSFTIAWYAIFITIGMIAAVLYTIFRAKKIGLTVDDVIDYALALIPTGIVGARLYYVLSKPENFDSFKDIINLRTGGLAIYGGIIGGFIACVILSHFKKIPFFAIADCCTPGIILAQAIGRWGNFMNAEAHGGVTDWFIRMGIYNSGIGDFIYYHPTFLYESLWNLLGFALVNIFYKHKKYDGQILLMTFGWYGFGRMFIEGLRTDSLYMNLFGLKLRTSQVLAAVIFIICTALLIYFAIKKPKREIFKREVTEPKEPKRRRKVSAEAKEQTSASEEGTDTSAPVEKEE